MRLISKHQLGISNDFSYIKRTQGVRSSRESKHKDQIIQKYGLDLIWATVGMLQSLCAWYDNQKAKLGKKYGCRKNYKWTDNKSIEAKTIHNKEKNQ